MEQQQQVEWDDLNKLLQHHGFKPVQFADPVQNKNLSDLVLLDRRSAAEVRATLRTMLTDSERRQALIHELVKSNNQLKEEVQEHMSRAVQQSQRATKLEGLLDRVKTRVQDLEDCYLSKAVQQHTQHLQQEKQEAQKLCEVLQQKLSKQTEEKAQLQRKLYFAVKEEERRLAQQSRTFQNICKKVSQCSSAADQQTLEVIDFCETKMSQLLDELRSVRGHSEGSDQKQTETSSSVTPSFKTILKAFQEQQKENKAQLQQLKREVESLKQELETRPTLKEVKFYKHKLRRLEGFNQPNKTSFRTSCPAVLWSQQTDRSVSTEVSVPVFSSHRVRDQWVTLRGTDGGILMRSAPLTYSTCRLCRLSEDEGTPESSEHIGDQAREASFCAHYHHLLTEISAVVTGPNAPLQLHRQKPSSVGVELTGFQSLLPTLEVWAQQLHLLKELQRGLDKLAVRLMPWQPPDCGHSSAEAVKVEDLMLLVDSLLENMSTDDDKVLRSPTPYTLGSMVSHFQKLFDVTSLSGVYPRMNEVYTRLGEMINAMRNLRDLLDLDSRVPPAEVVNQVSTLVSSTKHWAGLHDVLGDADINSIIIKVQQHEDFFPAFHALATEILQTLGVSRLDDVLPALKSLKQTAEFHPPHC